MAWAVGTPTIAAVLPLTNPPSFDIGLDISGGDAVQVGDVIRLRIDGGTTYDSAPLTLADLVAGTITIANGTLSAGVHSADTSVRRGGVQVSAWSTPASFTIIVTNAFVLLWATMGLAWSQAVTPKTVATQGFIR